MTAKDIKHAKNKTSFKKLALVVYNGNHAPKYFEVSRNFLKFLLVSLPFITLASLAGLLTLAFYFQEMNQILKSQEPVIISKLEEKISSLEAQSSQLQLENQDLLERLASGDDINLDEYDSLRFFRPTPGMENLISEALLTIDDIETNKSNENLELSFNITNQTAGNERLSGYLFVMLKRPDGILVYPSTRERAASFQLNFNQGESFLTQRFRPVENIVFPLGPNQTEALVQIIVFSRTGDLLHQQLIAINIET